MCTVPARAGAFLAEMEKYMQQTEARKKRQMLVITGAYGFYYMGYTSAFSFMMVFLTSSGYKDAQTGIIYSLMALMSLITQPILGFLSDSKIPIKKLVLCLLAAAIPFGFVLPVAARSYALVTASVLILAFFDQSLMVLMDSWTYMAREQNDKIVYSVARGMGSFTSAITGLIMGRAIAGFGAASIFWFHAGFMAVALIIALCFDSVPCKNKTSSESGVQGYSLPQAFGVLCRNKKYMLMLGGLLLLNIGNRAVVTYLPMMIRNFGGGAAEQGLSITMLTIGIFPVMLVYPYLARRFRVEKLLSVACVLVVCRVLSMAVVNDLHVVVYMQLLEALAFGLYNPSLIEYTSQIAPAQLRSSAITISSAVQVAVCGIVGNMLASAFMQFWSLKAMYTVYTAMAVLGLVLMAASIKTPHNTAKKQEVAA